MHTLLTSLKSSEESLHKEQIVASSTRPSYSPHCTGLSALSLRERRDVNTNEVSRMSIRLFERGKNEMMFWEGLRALSMFVCSYTCPSGA